MILFKLTLVFHLFSNAQILNICYIPCTYIYMVQVHDLSGILSYKFSTLTYEQDENIYHDVSCSHNFSRGGGANKTLTFTIKVLARNTKVLLKMLCNSETDRGSKTSQILYLSLFLFCISVQLTSCVSDTSYNATTTMLTNNTSNNSIGDDLYVIKAMVYEIGILTDADNATNDTTERQEVELSFYNSPIEDNGSP